MPEKTPVETKNLDIYGNAELPWGRPRDILVGTPSRLDITFFLGTVRADGRPHSGGVGALWHEGDFFLVSGPHTQKSHDLAGNPACTLSVRLEGIDLVMEGEAHRITDTPTLELAAKLYRESGWPVEVQGDAFNAPYSAPSAGPPPWYLYRITIHTAFGVATAEPNGATRWKFEE